MGKRTAIWLKIDFDILFFLDVQAVPQDRYHEFIDDVHDVITLKFERTEGSPKSTACTVFVEGFYFDLLPAPLAPCGGNAEDQLRYRILNPISDINANKGLSEAHLILMKEQSAFVHALARLLKLWSHSVLVPDFHHGRSFRMEIFAIITARGCHSDDMLHGFRQALGKIVRFRTMLYIQWERFYDVTLVPPDVMNQRPLLLDPGNPHSNLTSYHSSISSPGTPTRNIALRGRVFDSRGFTRLCGGVSVSLSTEVKNTYSVTKRSHEA
jgi:hypothetical protein